jgi:hypothetical protein
MFRLLLSPILHETEGEIQIFLRLFNYIMFRPLLKDGICGKFIFPVQTCSIFFSKLPEHLLLQIVCQLQSVRLKQKLLHISDKLRHTDSDIPKISHPA